MKDKVRVAGGQGFWGDLLTAPIDQVRGGPIDYLMLDYLAEVTMSIMQKQCARDPQAGYAKDFVSSMWRDNAGLRREKYKGSLERRRSERRRAAPRPSAKPHAPLGSAER